MKAQQYDAHVKRWWELLNEHIGESELAAEGDEIGFVEDGEEI